MERPAAVTMIGIVTLLLSAGASAQDVLPFPSPPMGGKVGPTMQESVHKWRTQPRQLPEDAPNILIVMLDDAGFGQPHAAGDHGLENLIGEESSNFFNHIVGQIGA